MYLSLLFSSDMMGCSDCLELLVENEPALYQYLMSVEGHKGVCCT